MNAWHEGSVFALDFETSGVDVFTDRIVSAALVKLVAGEQVDQRTWLLAQDIEIPAEATEVHGITTERMRAEGQPVQEALVEIAGMVAQVLRSHTPLVLFNACFDLSMLESELRRHGLRTLTDLLDAEHWNLLVDGIVLARGIDKNLSRSFKDPKTGKGWVYKLPNCCERYRVPFTESHDATADAAGAARLVVAILRKFPQIAGYSPHQLHQLQRTWAKANQDSLRAFWQRNDDPRAAGVDSGWPLHSDLLSPQGVLVR